MLILLLALIKIPLMAFMLWLPFREELAGTEPATESENSDEDGGTKTPPMPGHPDWTVTPFNTVATLRAQESDVPLSLKVLP